MKTKIKLRELKNYVLLDNGSVQASHYSKEDDESMTHLRHFDYNDKGELCLCYDRYDESDKCFHYQIVPVVDTSDSEQDLVLSIKEQ